MQTLDYDQYVSLQKQVGTSFYIFDEKTVKQNFHSFYHAFASRYPNVVIGYSYKTNYLPYLCKQMQHFGAYAEVVSRMEYDLALAIGQATNRIIFNGPLKTYEDIRWALDLGSIVNLDSFYEIDHLRRYCSLQPDAKVKIGLRVNFDVRDGQSNPLQNGYEVSRFGFCVENGNFERALEQLKQIPNVQVVGLHAHFSTNRSLTVYKRITQQLCTLAKTFLSDALEYIDIGGGMYGQIPATFPISDVPTFDDYATVICEIMLREWGRYNGPKLIIEPGIALVANAFQFVTEVIDVKLNNGHKFVLVDGSVHNIKPTMHKFNLPFEVISKNKSTFLDHFHIVGYTCMEKDYIVSDYFGALPHRGDIIVFDHVGAYTIVFNPPFIKERPAVVATSGEQFFEIRRKESFIDFFKQDHMQNSDLKKLSV